MMARHYSSPKGFVGRQLFYRIEYDGILYGCIGFGSATRFLPGRIKSKLERGLNNIFYHVEKVNGKYPARNFTIKALLLAEQKAKINYSYEYNDPVEWFESLVELPRSGDLYIRAGYKEVGITKGFTCKRTKGFSTDNWSGKRIWDTTNLRPKRVFIKDIVDA